MLCNRRERVPRSYQGLGPACHCVKVWLAGELRVAGHLKVERVGRRDEPRGVWVDEVMKVNVK